MSECSLNKVPRQYIPFICDKSDIQLLYKSHFLLPSTPSAVKVRPPKPYRHPSLDKSLTRHRLVVEARLLQKLKRAGVPSPALYFLNENEGTITMEWIEGPSIRSWLEDHSGEIELVTQVMRLIGTSVGGLHASGVVHGDLTTSNLILRESSGGELDVVLIDFGLGSVSISEEDMAVDLYVLERAFASTHPKSEGLV
jgi:TP53 regulating kinase and related kinases